MRMLCILFSVFVIFLSVKPCCADDDCYASVKSEKAGASKTRDCAGCSPFFACGSCAGFTITKNITAALLHATVKTAHTYPAYQQPYVKDIILSIWQPPQLA